MNKRGCRILMNMRNDKSIYDNLNKSHKSKFRAYDIILHSFLALITVFCIVFILFQYMDNSLDYCKYNECEYPEDVKTLPIIEETVMAASESTLTELEVLEASKNNNHIKPKNLDADLFEVVLEECENLDIPVNFVLAVMKTETQNFNVNDVSYNSNGTCDNGIMQINSSNVENFAIRYNIPEFASNPCDPIYNIRVGIRYLAEHYHTYLCQYEGDIDKSILAASGAYNRGAYNQNKYRNIYDYNARVYKHYMNLENGLDVNVNYTEEIPAFKEELQRNISL